LEKTTIFLQYFVPQKGFVHLHKTFSDLQGKIFQPSVPSLSWSILLNPNIGDSSALRDHSQGIDLLFLLGKRVFCYPVEIFTTEL